MRKKDNAGDEDTKGKTPRNLNTKITILVGLLVLSLGAAVYFWQDARGAKSSTPEAIAAKSEEESKQIISQLSKTLLVKSDAEPTVARIEDPDTLKQANPDFYADAVEGDYLILYPQRAIIFRSSENKIVNIAPIIDASRLSDEQEVQSEETSETDN